MVKLIISLVLIAGIITLHFVFGEKKMAWFLLWSCMGIAAYAAIGFWLIPESHQDVFFALPFIAWIAIAVHESFKK